MISKKTIQNVLEAAISTGGDFAEIYVEDTKRESINLLDGHLESTQSGRDFGVGIRIFSGLNSVYAFTNGFDEDDLVKTALKAAQAIKGKGTTVIPLSLVNGSNIHIIKTMPDTIEKIKKLDVVRTLYNSAKDFDPVIKQVSAMYTDVMQNVMIANTQGLLAEDSRVYTRISAGAVAELNGQMQTGTKNPGAHKGFEFIEGLNLEKIGKDAAKMAKTMVQADYCKAGVMPVVIDNGFGGVIFHEACGHGLEATSVAKGTSVFADKLGQPVASELVTAIDDGTIPNAWGSTNIDDEGMKTQKKTLIDKGILKSYMIDRFNARKMGIEANGSSRRQSYRFSPTSRMSNTYIANGNSKKEEIIADTQFGFYAKEMGGGSVNPGTGEFNFAVLEGYMIRNGKIAEPVRGATLIGKGSEILKKIDMVADNMEMAQGMCGSASGSIPANVGQPTIRVSSITVGGR